MSPASRRLRDDLPFRRIALVLAGGGALGAYEVGVLRVLEAVALAPALVAGVSIGAINAVVWLAHGRRTEALERAWRSVRPGELGLHWVSLALRISGALAAAVAALETVLAVVGSRELSGAYWLWRRGSAKLDVTSLQLDLASWILLLVVGVAITFFAPRLGRALAARIAAGDAEAARARLGRLAIAAAAVHMLVWVMGWPWPHRFSASVVVLLTLAWIASGPGRLGRWVRGIGLGLMPETSGRGLWSGRARRRVLERLVAGGDVAALTGPGTGLVVSALAVDSGRITHFTSWPHPSDAFVRRAERELGEVVPLRDTNELLAAAVASSAIPGLFEPERIGGREFVDAGGFSNQPLHLAFAADADAAIVVLLTPSASPAPSPPPGGVIELGGRLLELANWRDLQTELNSLPAGWSREGSPANVCVVEPGRPLPAQMLSFDPARADELVRLGEQDAWVALERAGWLARG